MSDVTNLMWQDGLKHIAISAMGGELWLSECGDITEPHVTVASDCVYENAVPTCLACIVARDRWEQKQRAYEEIRKRNAENAQ